MKYTKDGIIRNSTMMIRERQRQRFIQEGREIDWTKNRRDPSIYKQVLTLEEADKYLQDESLSPLVTVYANDYALAGGSRKYAFFSADNNLFNRGGVYPKFSGISCFDSSDSSSEIVNSLLKNCEMIYCLDHLVEVCNFEYERIIIPV